MFEKGVRNRLGRPCGRLTREIVPDTFVVVYQVHDESVVITVIAVGRRDKVLVYLSAKKRV